MNPFTKRYSMVQPFYIQPSNDGWYRFFDIFNDNDGIKHRYEYINSLADFLEHQKQFDENYSRMFPHYIKRIDYNRERLREAKISGAKCATDIVYQHRIMNQINGNHEMTTPEYISLLIDLPVYFLPVGRYSTVLSIVKHNEFKNKEHYHGSPLRRILKIESIQ